MTGEDVNQIKTDTATTALDAAEGQGCKLDQIVKSIVLQGSNTGTLYLFITAETQKVNLLMSAALASEPLEKAPATVIRSVTGFAIGGVSAIGHLNPITEFFDTNLMKFPVIYAAAGTPIHIFGYVPLIMQRLCKSLISNFY